MLDHASATAQQLADAIERATTEASFRENIHLIAESFRAAGGYPLAVDEVFAMKKAHGIA